MEAFVPPGREGDARTGDRVEARIESIGRRRQTDVRATILRIIEPFDPEIVGTIVRENEQWLILPDRRRWQIPALIPADLVAAQKLGSGARVLVRLASEPTDLPLPPADIVEHFGAAGELEAETRATMRNHRLVEEFSAEALTEAWQQARQAETIRGQNREDLSGVTTITIDPADARDFDDALSLNRDSNGLLTLGVHIADVSAFVPGDGPLDREALARGTSVYFPHKAIPMLPEVLSTDVCSLREDSPRATLSAFITYDADGRVVARRFCESVIRSRKRLTYEQAQAICDGEEIDVSPDVAELVRHLSALATLIERRRVEDGMLRLDLPEVGILLDDAGRVRGAHKRPELWTHRIVEAAMVEANEAVAWMLSNKNVPFMYRVHPKPDTERFGRLEALVRSLGIPISKAPKNQEIQDLLAGTRDRPEAFAVNLAVLRSFEQARYSADPEGHYALASEGYCHFTSPIRRYPDLTVHRALKRLLRRDRTVVNDEDVAELAVRCTQTERRAEAAERDLRTSLVLALLARQLGETFEGAITAINDKGLFVRHPEYLIEGLVRLSELGQEWWDVESLYGIARGRTTGTTYHIGEPLEVRIARVDLARRHLDLIPAGKPYRTIAPESGTTREHSAGRPVDPLRKPSRSVQPKARKTGKKGGPRRRSK